MKFFICPFCGEQVLRGNQFHVKKCFDIWLENQDKTALKEKLFNEYVINEKSINSLSSEFNLSYGNVEKLLSMFEIKKRTISEQALTKYNKEKVEKTNIERYGEPHNFCKNHPSRKKWEKRLLEEEGITNVFQRESVISQIKETMINKYGEEGVYYNRVKGSTLEYWIDKLGEEEGIKKFNEINYNKGKTGRKEYWIDKYGEEEGIKKWYNRIYKFNKTSLKAKSSLNILFENILKDNNIEYQDEFVIKNGFSFYAYDFKIKNVLFELNGDFWHCNPKIYKPNDIVNYPQGNIKAKEKWESDKRKKEYAEKFGYKVVTVWESDIKQWKKDKTLVNQILKIIDYEISKN